MQHMTPDRFRFLMRQNHWTIRNLAESAGVTQKRIRRIREIGVKGYVDVTSWLELLTGRNVFSRAYYDKITAQ